MIRVRHLIPLLAWGLTIVFFFYFLEPLKLVLLGFLAALCLTALLRPLVSKLSGPRPIKGFAVGLLPIIVCAGLLFLATWLLVPPLRSQLSHLPRTEHRFDVWLANISARLGLDSNNPLTLQDLFAEFARIAGGAGFVQRLSSNLADVLIGAVFVFIGCIYMLAEPAERAIPAFLRLLPDQRRLQAQAAFTVLELRLRWWLIGALIMAVTIGATSLVAFWLIGLDLFIPLAILAGLSEFVPTIGPTLAFLVALAFAATQGLDKVLWLLGVYVATHILESYILIPYIHKRTVRIPPVVTLFTIVLWGQIFGIGGFLLAVPIDLVLWTLAEHFLGSEKELVIAANTPAA